MNVVIPIRSVSTLPAANDGSLGSVYGFTRIHLVRVTCLSDVTTRLDSLFVLVAEGPQHKTAAKRKRGSADLTDHHRNDLKDLLVEMANRLTKVLVPTLFKPYYD